MKEGGRERGREGGREREGGEVGRGETNIGSGRSGERENKNKQWIKSKYIESYKTKTVEQYGAGKAN